MSDNSGFVGHPAAWFEVDEIYEFYWQNHLENGWGMPKRWLLSLSYGRQLQDHPGMYGLRLDERGRTSMAETPATVGDFDFRIAAIVGSPYQCRIGDFVEPGSLPPRFGDRDTVYINPVALPQYSPSDELLPSAPLPTLVYRERRFSGGARKVFSLWRRES